MKDWLVNKKDYREFCKLHNELPVFFQDWWLDVVCGIEAWQVCLSKDKGGNIRGVLPFYQTTQKGFQVIKMPALTPYLGAWLNYPLKKEKKEALHRFQKKVITDLVKQLPKVAYYAQQHPPQLKNGLPFFWNGFSLNTRFSYRLDATQELETLFSNLKGSVRTEIRKAKEKILISESEDLKLFYDLLSKSFERQSLAFPYTFSFMEKIDQVLKKHHRRKLLIAKDKDGNTHACIYLLWDDQVVYNLLQGADPKFGDSGAIKLLLWNGVKLANERKAIFDFEGGMMQNIEPVFSAFGGDLCPYLKIYKGGSKVFKILSAIKNG